MVQINKYFAQPNKIWHARSYIKVKKGFNIGQLVVSFARSNINSIYTDEIPARVKAMTGCVRRWDYSLRFCRDIYCGVASSEGVTVVILRTVF